MKKHNVFLRNNQYYVQPWHKLPILKEMGGSQKGAYYAFPRQRWVLKRLLNLLGSKNLAFDKDVMADWKHKYGFTPIETDIDFTQHRVWGQLKNYQQEAVEFLLTSPYKGGLLNIDPGLGKTFTSIAAAAIAGVKIALVIAPKSFLPGWLQELKIRTGQSGQICHQIKPTKLGWVFTNPETVLSHPEWFDYQNWDVLIIDESLDVKNRKSNRFDVYKKLKRNYTWLLSGSPISKFADDLWAQLHLISPKAFKSYWRFANFYCIVIKTQWGDKVTGNRPKINIRDEFKDIMFTIKEHELDLDKPEMIHEEVIVPMNSEQTRVFWEFKSNFEVALETTVLETTSVAAQLTYLQQIVSHPINIDADWTEPAPKLEYLLELYKEHTAKLPSIVWTWWRQTGVAVYKALKKEGYKVGVKTGTSSEPEDAIQQFQQGHLEILVLSLGVGKYGHTLNNARSAIYYDRTFDADAFVQSQQRILGGLRGTVVKEPPTTFTLKSPGSTDMFLEENLIAKAQSLSQVASHDLLTLLRSLTHGS